MGNIRGPPKKYLLETILDETLEKKDLKGKEKIADFGKYQFRDGKEYIRTNEIDAPWKTLQIYYQRIRGAHNEKIEEIVMGMTEGRNLYKFESHEVPYKIGIIEISLRQKGPYHSAITILKICSEFNDEIKEKIKEAGTAYKFVNIGKSRYGEYSGNIWGSAIDTRKVSSLIPLCVGYMKEKLLDDSDNEEIVGRQFERMDYKSEKRRENFEKQLEDFKNRKKGK